MRADLRPMAIVPRAPGEYAPAAGARAVAAVMEAAAPLSGTRVLHVSAAGRPAPRRSCWARRSRSPPAPGWTCAGGPVRRPAARRRGHGAEHGLRGGESGIEDAAGRTGWRPAGSWPLAQRRGRHVVLHDAARLAWRPGSTCRWCGAVTATCRGPSPRRSGAWPPPGERCRLVLVPDASFAPRPSRRRCWRPRRASIRWLRATSSSRRACPAGWCGRWAWTSSGPSASRCWSWTAGTTPMR